MKCADRYYEIYNKAPMGVAFCPYRVCPLGAHSDHQFGKITGFAIDKGIHIAYGPKQNGVVELTSLQFGKRAQFHVALVPGVKENDWADYLRGATVALGKRHHLSLGMSCVIEGTLPIGGLSSSAAVIISFLEALTRVNGITLSEEELIEIALEAENKYVGVSCGKMDQSCEVYSKANNLLYLDTLDSSYELIKAPDSMKPFRIGIFFSGIERNLGATKFNMRVDECRAAAYSLLAFAGIEYGKFDKTQLRDVPYEVYLAHKDKLPTSFRLRAEHYYTEQMRVEKGVAAFRAGDIEAFGALCTESGNSSIVNWEAGSDELKLLYRTLVETDGVYGGRFSGAGFKGCCMALVDPAKEDAIRVAVSEKYKAAFPSLADKFSIHFCDTASGVSFKEGV